jgi:hypothetical protein
MMRACLAGSVIAATIAGAQSAPSAGRVCLTFDRPAVSWQYHGVNGRWAIDSSAVIALDTERVKGAAGARRINPVPGGAVDTWSKSLWSPSYWHPLGGDSLEIVWTTHLVGSLVRLSGRDTLRGTARDFSDVITFDKSGRRLAGPPPRPIRAIRTACHSIGPTTAADSTCACDGRLPRRTLERLADGAPVLGT